MLQFYRYRYVHAVLADKHFFRRLAIFDRFTDGQSSFLCDILANGIT